MPFPAKKHGIGRSVFGSFKRQAGGKVTPSPSTTTNGEVRKYGILPSWGAESDESSGRSEGSLVNKHAFVSNGAASSSSSSRSSVEDDNRHNFLELDSSLSEARSSDGFRQRDHTTVFREMREPRSSCRENERETRDMFEDNRTKASIRNDNRFQKDIPVTTFHNNSNTSRRFQASPYPCNTNMERIEMAGKTRNIISSVSDDKKDSMATIKPVGSVLEKVRMFEQKAQSSAQKTPFTSPKNGVSKVSSHTRQWHHSTTDKVDPPGSNSKGLNRLIDPPGSSCTKNPAIRTDPSGNLSIYVHTRGAATNNIENNAPSPIISNQRPRNDYHNHGSKHQFFNLNTSNIAGVPKEPIVISPKPLLKSTMTPNHQRRASHGTAKFDDGHCNHTRTLDVEESKSTVGNKGLRRRSPSAGSLFETSRQTPSNQSHWSSHERQNHVWPNKDRKETANDDFRQVIEKNTSSYSDMKHLPKALALDSRDDFSNVYESFRRRTSQSSAKRSHSLKAKGHKDSCETFIKQQSMSQIRLSPPAKSTPDDRRKNKGHHRRTASLPRTRDCHIDKKDLTAPDRPLEPPPTLLVPTNSEPTPRAPLSETRRILNTDDPSKCTYWVTSADGSCEHLEFEVENTRPITNTGNPVLDRDIQRQTHPRMWNEVGRRIRRNNSFSSRNCLTPSSKKNGSRRRKLTPSISFRGGSSSRSRLRRSFSFNSLK